MRPVRGFSIVELLAALVLLAVGLAAFVRAAGAVARLEGDARLRRVVAAMMLARLDSLRGLPCGEARSGYASYQGVHERWTVVPLGRRLALSDTITIAARPSMARGLDAQVACRP